MNKIYYLQISSTYHGETTIYNESEIDEENLKTLLLFCNIINSVTERDFNMDYLMKNISSLPKGEYIQFPVFSGNRSIFLKLTKK